MTTIKCFSLALSLFALLVNAQAQTPRVSTVNVRAEANRVRVSPEGDAFDLRLDVADESGEVVFQSGQVSGQSLDWDMRDSAGARVAPGTYQVTVTYRAPSGKLRKRVEQVSVQEVVTAPSAQAQAPAGPAPAAAVSSPVPVKASGSVTVGRLPRFTGLTSSQATVADSVITQTSAGNVGVGLANPATRLHLWGPNSRLRLTSTNSGQWTVTEYQTNNRVWHTGVGGSTVPNDLRGKYYIHDATAGADRLVIDTAGNVGIGTNSPVATLHVAGLLYARSPTTTAVSGSSAGSTGVVGESQNSNLGSSVAGIVGVNNNGGWAGYFHGPMKVFGSLTVEKGCTGCTAAVSDRALKANLSAVDPRSVLDRLAALPIKEWSYKSDSPSVRHLGPMAQDFRAAFNLGKDDRHIDLIDANGVTMAAVQALYQLMKEKDRQIESLSGKLEERAREAEEMRARLLWLEQSLDKK